MVFWRVHLALFSRSWACAQVFLSLKKTPLWKVSYEECSLFETSTTQTPILSRIESLAVHINTFQAQIKKCKQNKKIYIYIIFSPIQRFQVSMQQILLNTESEEHTVQTVGTNRSLRRLLPFKHMGWGWWTAWNGERRRREGRWGERMRCRRERICTGEDGAAGTHTWWVGGFHLLVFVIFFLVHFLFSFPPIPRSNNGRKPPHWLAGPY